MVHKILFGLTLLVSASAIAEDHQSKLNACRLDCTSFTELGWERKACLATCEEKYNRSLQTIQYCNTDEEDCERDDNGDVWGEL